VNIPHELEQWRKGVDLIRVPLVKFAGKKLPTLSCVDISRAVLEVIAEVDSLKAQLAVATAQRDELRADVRDLTDVLRRNGFRECDNPACNCNSWHHVDGFAARFREIDEAVGEHNGKTLLCAVEEKLANLDQCVREREALAKSYRETVDQRDELLRAAIKVSNTSPRTSSSNERDLDHYDACTELGIVIERIARAQSGQPCRECDGEGIIEKCDWPGEHANRYQEPCPSCKPQSGQPASGGCAQ
jgi:hypothetical protein